MRKVVAAELGLRLAGNVFEQRAVVGVDADGHGGRVDGGALLLKRFAVEAAVIVHGNTAGAAVAPADVRRGLERDDIPCRIAVPLLILLIGAIVTTVKGKKKKQQQEANEKEKRAAAYAPPMGSTAAGIRATVASPQELEKREQESRRQHMEALTSRIIEDCKRTARNGEKSRFS